MTTVVNMSNTKNFDVKIDRSTRWGNPFTVTESHDRAAVLQEYEDWLRRAESKDALWVLGNVGMLKDKILGCWCAPLDCHGEVLARLADGFPL